MPIRFHCIGFIDRRGKRELEAARVIDQARADAALEAHYRERVSRNAKEIRRLTGRVVSFQRPTALEHALMAPAGMRRQAS